MRIVYGEIISLLIILNAGKTGKGEHDRTAKSSTEEQFAGIYLIAGALTTS